MNIGIVTTWFERGAAYVSRQFKDILEKEKNIEVFIYVRGGEKYAKGDSEWDVDRIHWGKKNPIRISTAIELKDFKKWIKKNKIEIIIFNEQRWLHPIITAKNLGVIIGLYVDYYKEDTIEFVGYYDFLICNTKRHYDICSWHQNAFYIPWGTNLQLFKPTSFKQAKNNYVTFFHSAGMNPKRKGTHLVIEALQRLEDKARLIVHSQRELSKVYPEKAELINDLIENNKLEVIEETVPAPGLYHTGDVYVYPSYLEGIGLTIAEASACGLPVITSDNPPMNEFIDNTSGKTVSIARYFSRYDGYYWPQCEVSIDDLTTKMRFYIENENNLEKYKKQARKYAEKNLDWNENAKELAVKIKSITTKELQIDKKLERKIINYEMNKHGLRMKIYLKSPFLYKLLYVPLRFMKRIMEKIF